MNSIKIFLVCFFVIGLILRACPSVGQSAVAGQNAWTHLQALTGSMDRSPGTPGAHQAADYIASVFSSLPEALGAVTGEQRFTTPMRHFSGASLTIDGISLPLEPLYANALAPEDLPEPGIRGSLIYVGKGRLKDFDGYNVRHSLVLMDLDSGSHWQHAANLGARAVIYLDNGQQTAPRLHFQDKEELTPVDFPRFWLPTASFTAYFGDPQGQATKEGMLHCRSSWQNVQARNLYCYIPGQHPEKKNELVIIEAFYDGSRYVPNQSPAADQAASIATLLALTQQYSTTPPQRSVLLLATSGHANQLMGLRQALWALLTKGKELKKERKLWKARTEQEEATLALLDQEKIGDEDEEINALIHTPLLTELRDEIERINQQLHRNRTRRQQATAELKALAEQKLILRRLSWENNFQKVPKHEQQLIRHFLPQAIAHTKQRADDATRRAQSLKSAKQLHDLCEETPIVAAVSLHLSTHGTGLASVKDGWLYQLRPTINRSRQYTTLRSILQRGAEHNQLAYMDLLGGPQEKRWFNYFPDQPSLGGEVFALAGLPGLTLATVNDLRSTWGTPYDTRQRVDKKVLLAQAADTMTLLAALTNHHRALSGEKAKRGFTTLIGRANFLRQGELFAEQPASQVLLQIYQDQQYTLSWVDSFGTFRLPGLADKKHSYGKAIIEGYRFLPGSNQASWAIDKPVTGKAHYRVKLNRKEMETDLIMFGCTQTTLFGLQDARRLTPLTRIHLIDARTETDPLHYWYSRIDTRSSQLCSLFLEPDVPFKLTLSDTVLEERLLLLNNSPTEKLGRGFPAASTPTVLHTPLQAARDMVQLITPRMNTLEKHAIVNQRLKKLLAQGQDHLAQAEQALRHQRFSTMHQEATASLAVAARVYNDLEATQKDVLAGVLFYIALFVPFAYCLERLLFAYVSINKRLLAFLGLLATVIAIIYNVHPAFELTYSPLVVVLAFFIIGLSFLVSLILFNRFEQEMKGLQQHAHVSGYQAISFWQAFLAAFAIGVTNLRRRRVRTTLTCITLIILTYTLLNFTSVRHSVHQAALRLQRQAPYLGLLVKAPEWKSLPPDLESAIRPSLPPQTQVMRLVWWETQDRIRPPALTLQKDGKLVNASAMIGLDPQAASLPGKNSSLLSGSWLAPGAPRQILLSQALARELGITSAHSHPRIWLWGIPFTVQGIFSAERFAAAVDLDSEPMTPVIYPNELSSELSEAEAEAAESGQDILTMSSRYQHLTGKRTVIIPAQALLQLGGSLKSLTIQPANPAAIAPLGAQLAERYQLLIYQGEQAGTWLNYLASSLNYSGMSTIFIPAILAMLIVLNTMISSVVERKREIGVYISVGLAPPHVASLFVAEAIAFGIISTVAGYLLAQTGAHFLSTTPLWQGMTANYSSLSGVMAMLMVMAVVLLSVIYPARVAARVAIPDVNRSWNLPQPENSRLGLTLPFLIKLHEQDHVAGFLTNYYRAHEDIAHGHFSTDRIIMEYACPLKVEDQTHPDCFTLRFRAWLAPFDFGIRQQVLLTACPSREYPDFLELRVVLIREAGEKNTWYRLCRGFINDLRKQLLIWRSLDLEEKETFHLEFMEKTGTQPQEKPQ